MVIPLTRQAQFR